MLDPETSSRSPMEDDQPIVDVFYTSTQVTFQRSAHMPKPRVIMIIPQPIFLLKALTIFLSLIQPNKNHSKSQQNQLDFPLSYKRVKFKNNKITAMIDLPFESQQLNAQTPIKRGKSQHVDQLTAESEQERTPGLEDISADVLFQQFAKLVKVSQDDEEPFDDSQEVERKLSYDVIPSMKLSFEPKTESMKKHLKLEPLESRGHICPATLFRPAPMDLHKHAEIVLNENDCFTPLERPRLDRPELQMTPHKEHRQE